MARYTGPKHRLARREKENIFGKESVSLGRRLNTPPGMHGPKGTRNKQSDFGLQLREKQKTKRIYGLMEKQFEAYYKMATLVKGKTGEAFLQILERRLDNAIYRLGFASSLVMARQMVTHGHVFVDGEKVTIPSYILKVGQVVNLSAKSLENIQFKKLLEKNETKVPEYYEKKAAVGRLVSIPLREQIPIEVNEQLITEFYSR